MNIVIGKNLAGGDAVIDLQRLTETRMIIQANSGGGKSWALRRLLEQSFGKVQHLVIDPEGEFYTLREKFDYILAAPRGGDCLLDPRTTGMLARRLLELGTSAILDISEMDRETQRRVVRLFLESVLSAPKTLRHPVWIPVDEVQIFAPEDKKVESSEAVVNLMTLGRKRALCGILASQRISKVDKDALDCNNKLIGRTALDTDMKRAGDELGMAKDGRESLRTLDDGEFFAFGPAISKTVITIRTGAVETSHPKAGEQAAPPAPPRGKVIAVLQKLADLPKEAEEEARTLAELQAKVRDLERKLRQSETDLKHARPGISPEEEGRILREGANSAHEEYRKRLGPLLDDLAIPLHTAARGLADSASRIVDGLNEIGSLSLFLDVVTAPKAFAKARAGSPAGGAVGLKEPPTLPPTAFDRDQNGAVPPIQQKILDSIAELEALGIAEPPRVQVAFLAGYSHPRSKGFTNALGALRSAGLIDYPSSGTLSLSEAGDSTASAVNRPRSSEELQERIMKLLPPVHCRLLEFLISHREPFSREALARNCGYEHVRSKGFTNALGRLHSLGLIDYPGSGQVAASKLLFLE